MARTKQVVSREKKQSVDLITPETELEGLKVANIKQFASYAGSILRKRKVKDFSELIEKDKTNLSQGLDMKTLEKIFTSSTKAQAGELYDQYFKERNKKEEKITALKEFFNTFKFVTSLTIKEKEPKKDKSDEEIADFVGRLKAEYASDFRRGEASAVLASSNEARYKEEKLKEFLRYTGKRNRSALASKEDRIETIKKMWESNWTKDIYNTVRYQPNANYRSYNKKDLGRAADQRGIATKVMSNKVPTVNDIYSVCLSEFTKKQNAKYKPDLDRLVEENKLHKDDSDEEIREKKETLARERDRIKREKERKLKKFKDSFEPLKRLSKLVSSYYVKQKGTLRKKLEKEISDEKKGEVDSLKERKKELVKKRKEGHNVSSDLLTIDNRLEIIQLDIDYKSLSVVEDPDMVELDNTLREKMVRLVEDPEDQSVFDDIKLNDDQTEEMEDAYSKIVKYINSKEVDQAKVLRDIKHDFIQSPRDLQKYELWVELKEYESKSDLEKKAMKPRDDKNFVHVDIPYQDGPTPNYKVDTLKQIAKKMHIKVADKRGEVIYNDIVEHLRAEGRKEESIVSISEMTEDIIRDQFIDKYGNPVPEEEFKKIKALQLRDYAKALGIPYTSKNKSQLIESIRKKLNVDNSVTMMASATYTSEVIPLEKLEQLSHDDLKDLAEKMGIDNGKDLRTEVLKQMLSTHMTRILPKQVKMRDEFVNNGVVPKASEKQAHLITCLVAFDHSLASTKVEDYGTELEKFATYLKGSRYVKKAAKTKKARVSKKKVVAKPRTSPRKATQASKRKAEKKEEERSYQEVDEESDHESDDEGADDLMG